MLLLFIVVCNVFRNWGRLMDSLCPLCNGVEHITYFEGEHRRYFQCKMCGLVFMDPVQRLAPAQEKAIYDHHKNSPDDLAYRKFLSRLYEPVIAKLRAGARGLDFGCGPGPTLSVMFEEAGFPMHLYDVYYCDDKSVLKHEYDFITATEVVEHLYAPGEVLRQLWGQLATGGLLGIMTKLVTDQAAFSNWHYKNDMSHVVFFSRETFAWVAQTLGAELTFFGADAVILAKR